MCFLGTLGQPSDLSIAIVLGGESVRNMLVNFASGLIFTAGPAFPFAAAMRAAVNLLRDGKAESVSVTLLYMEDYPNMYSLHKMRAKLQFNVRYFFDNLFSRPVWEKAKRMELLSIPVAENYEFKKLLTQIVPLWTQARDNHHLASHLHLRDYKAFPVSYPVVPKGQGRIRLVFHAGNTTEEIDTLIGIICDWAQEMIDSLNNQVPLTCTWARIIQAGEVKKQQRLKEQEKLSGKVQKVAHVKQALQPLIAEAKAHQYVEKSNL